MAECKAEKQRAKKALENNNMFIKDRVQRIYYTLADIAKASGQYENIGPMSAVRAGDGIENFCELVLNEPTSVAETEEGKKLWQEYIWPTVYSLSIYYQDGAELDEDELLKAVENKVGQIYFWFKSTYENRKVLIDFYSAAESSLMDNIKSTSLSKYNDTPQDGGNFDTDDHTTNSTRIETSTAGDTPINRLDEIRKKLRNIYEDWYREFVKLFIIY